MSRPMTKPVQQSRPVAPKPKPAAVAPAKSATPATPNAPTSAAPAAPSMMGNIMSSAVGSFAGVMIADSLFGGKKEQVQQVLDQPGGLAAIQKTIGQDEATMKACGIQFNSFVQCLEHNNQDITSCQWAYDIFSQCKRTPTQAKEW